MRSTMRCSRLIYLPFLLAVVFSVTTFTSTCSATLITKTNATPTAAVNGTSTTSTVTVLAADTSGENIITDVNVTVGFTGATQGGFQPPDWQNFGLVLQSPASTIVPLVLTGTTFTLASTTQPNPVARTLTFDDAAIGLPSVDGSNDPNSGTFDPNTPLSAFNTENVLGTWTLTVSDAVLDSTDDIRVDTWTLSATTAVPEPSAAVFFGLVTLVGVGVGTWKKVKSRSASS